MITSAETRINTLPPNTPIQIGIYNEIDPLKSTTIWGPVGAEAVLTQLYTKGRSLFFDEMDVPKAREEGLLFADFLKNRNIQVTIIRDQLASMLPVNDVDHRQVRDGIVTRTRKIILDQNYEPTPIFNGTTPEYVAMDLLEKDIERYGEENALALNEHLLLTPNMPLGNAMFSRDQMNVLLNARVISKMSYPIRQPEVPLYEAIYASILKDHQRIELPESETFEGGDAYIFNNTVYVGVGIRTTRKAALTIYNQLQDKIEEAGLRYAIVEDTSRKSQQDAIHIDTYSGPISKNVIAVCRTEAERRNVSFVGKGKEGETEIIETGMNFVEHLLTEGNTVLEIPKKEQVEFGCNFLVLRDNEIVLPLISNQTTNDTLQKAGVIMHIVNLEQSTKGNGAAHCMSGQLARN